MNLVENITVKPYYKDVAVVLVCERWIIMTALGNKEIFATNLKRMIARSGKSQKDICSDLSLRESSFSDWVNAKTYPRIDKIQLLAEYFKVPKSALIEHPATPIHRTCISIPVVGRVAAGLPLLAEEEIIDYEEIAPEMAEGGRIFGLRVKGDSMEPRICEGDVLIVREQPDADSGDVVIALIDGEDAVVKRLMKYSDGIALISNNPHYKDMIFSAKDIERKPVQIIGKVLENRQKF